MQSAITKQIRMAGVLLIGLFLMAAWDSALLAESVSTRGVMVTPDEDRWEQAENAFLQSLKWGKESQFQYRVVDTLESLVTLYYFWNGASDVSNDTKANNQEKIRSYQQEIEQLKVFPIATG